jgi:hypothetical protein
VAEELTFDWHRILPNRRQERVMKPVARIATLFLGLVALAHLLRVALQIPVTAGNVAIPLWVSALACLVTGGLAVLLWRESRR